MAKSKKEIRITKNEQQLLEGRELIKRHPLFGKLHICAFHVPASELGKNIPARVSSSSCIYLNKDCDRSPEEWAYLIAHCMLHLSFGHFDAERIPGYWQKISEKQQIWVNRYDPGLWNMACDIFIARFLLDIRFGRSNISAEKLAVYGSSTDERKIYEYLVTHHIPVKYDDFGTAGERPDMIGTDSPLTYRYGQNSNISEFAYALAESVRSVIDKAGNMPADHTNFLCLPRGKDCRGAGRLVGQTDRTEMKVCVSESSSGLISSLVRSTSAQFRR